MSADRRITKRQIKEDKLVTTAFKATEYVQKNSKTFTVVGVVVLVLVVGLLWSRWNSHRKENRSLEMLTRAQLYVAAGDTESAIAEFSRLVDEFGGTSSAKMGCYLLANLHLDSGNYDKALTYFERFLREYSKDKMMASGMAATAAACYELKGDFIAAGRMHMKAAELQPDELFAPSYLLKAGLDFSKGGDSTAAETALKRLITTYPESFEASTARRTLAEITY